MSSFRQEPSGGQRWSERSQEGKFYFYHHIPYFGEVYGATCVKGLIKRLTLLTWRDLNVANAHRSRPSFWANSCQSLPLALAVSKVAQIRCRMDEGILKALGPVWEVTVQSVCIKNGTESFSAWSERTVDPLVYWRRHHAATSQAMGQV